SGTTLIARASGSLSCGPRRFRVCRPDSRICQLSPPFEVLGPEISSFAPQSVRRSELPLRLDVSGRALDGEFRGTFGGVELPPFHLHDTDLIELPELPDSAFDSEPCGEECVRLLPTSVPLVLVPVEQPTCSTWIALEVAPDATSCAEPGLRDFSVRSSSGAGIVLWIGGTHLQGVADVRVAG